MTSTTTTDQPMSRDACVRYLQTHGIYSGHSRDSIDQLRQLVADHQAPAAELRPDGPERVAAAKAEHKALQAWIKDGENPPRPATPNLDALNEAYAAGVTAKDRRAAAKATGGAKAPVAEPPKPGAGHTVIALRNDGHAQLVATVVTDGATVENHYLVVRNRDAQPVFDQLVAATDGASQFHTRLLTLAQLLVRQAFQAQVTDDRNSLLTRLVNHLAAAAGTDWAVTWAGDATPVFVISGITYTTTRAAAEAVGVPTKAPAAE